VIEARLGGGLGLRAMTKGIVSFGNAAGLTHAGHRPAHFAIFGADVQHRSVLMALRPFASFHLLALDHKSRPSVKRHPNRVCDAICLNMLSVGMALHCNEKWTSNQAMTYTGNTTLQR
jgi:hypothetical protein